MIKTFFPELEKIEAIFLKVLTANEVGDMLSKHGVVVPVSAYRFFPEFPNFRSDYERNHSLILVGAGSLSDKEVTGQFSYKHYSRYPERRLTRLLQFLPETENGTLLLMGRCIDGTYRISYINANEKRYSILLDEIGLLDGKPGSFYLDLKWNVDERVKPSSHESEFLTIFQQVKNQGYVPAISTKSSAVGYTFENLLGIDPNNYPGPDFKDIEIKCHEIGFPGSNDMDLFLKEPDWLDGLDYKDRISKYGYWDAEKGRYSLYTRVHNTPNNLDLAISENWIKNDLYLKRAENEIARWEFSILKRRLLEKFPHAASVGARVRNSGDTKEFHYSALTLMSKPSIGGFIELTGKGDIWAEFRMHVDKHGKVRNHGTQFRVKESKLDRLFSRVLVWQD